MVKNGCLTGVKDLSPYFIDMLKAMNYCHEVANVIDLDIKPDKIMINYNNEAVLINFGVSAICDKPEDLNY